MSDVTLVSLGIIPLWDVIHALLIVGHATVSLTAPHVFPGIQYKLITYATGYAHQHSTEIVTITSATPVRQTAQNVIVRQFAHPVTLGSLYKLTNCAIATVQVLSIEMRLPMSVWDVLPIVVIVLVLAVLNVALAFIYLVPVPVLLPVLHQGTIPTLRLLSV